MPENRSNRWMLVLLGLVVLAGYLGHIAYFWHQINDDAFITFRYSRFLALGRGPYFNVGEQVEGYTNLLMMLLMAGVIAIFGPDHVLLAAKLICVAGGLVAICAAWALCARWLRKIECVKRHAAYLAWAAGAVVAANSAYALNSTTGLETALYSALVVAGLWLVQRAGDEQRWCGAGIVFALAALSRPEGLMVFAAALFGRVLAAEWRDRPGRIRLLTDTSIVAVVVAAHVGFRFAFYDGELLPNTYYAKRGWEWTTDALVYARDMLTTNLGCVLPLLAVAGLFARGADSRRSILAALTVVVASILGVLATGPGWMPGYRLLIPYVPVWAALAIGGVGAIADRIRWKATATGVVISLGLLAFLFWWQGDTRREYRRYTTVRAKGYVNGHTALADWLNEHTHPGDTIALMDIGIVGYRCIDRDILDITGLTDRHIARSGGKFFDKDYDPAYIFERKPKYFIIAAAAPLGPIDRTTRRQVTTWTPGEGRLYNTALFHKYYVRRRRVAPSATPLEQMAAHFGAEHVFLHDHPKANYLLLAFRYRDE